VIRDCQKIESSARSGFGAKEEWTRSIFAGLTLATRVAVRGVRLQIASMPCCFLPQDGHQDRGFVCNTA
jgi:hypothetical protein